MKEKNTKRIAFVTALSLIVIASIIRMLTVLNHDPMVLETFSNAQDALVETLIQSNPEILTADTIGKASDTELAEVKINEFPVYICGSVLVPGVYDIEYGTYVYQLIDMAGGLDDDAAVDYVNQVYLLVEPISIYIPSTEELKDNHVYSNSSLVRNESDVYIWGNGGESGDGNETDVAIPAKVNINTAGREELMTLAGVGQVTADAIISYRETVSAFRCIEDIMNVPGIKTARFETFKLQITV